MEGGMPPLWVPLASVPSPFDTSAPLCVPIRSASDPRWAPLALLGHYWVNLGPSLARPWVPRGSSRAPLASWQVLGGSPRSSQFLA